jgi:hypothetical protein
MANYSFTMKRTASATLDVGSILTAASNPRRFRLVDLILGAEGTPADNGFLWEVNKRTGLATGGTSVTGQPLEDGDTIASTLVGNQAPTANGAGSGNKLSIPLNQRNTFRWMARAGGAIVVPATASNGLGFSTPTSSAVAVTCCAHVEEL